MQLYIKEKIPSGPYKLLKQLQDLLVFFFYSHIYCLLYRFPPLSYSSGLLSTWKSSHIVPISKSSPPSAFPSDFHSISLFFSLVSKFLEKLVHSILLNFCFQQARSYLSHAIHFSSLSLNNLCPPVLHPFCPCAC